MPVPKFRPVVVTTQYVVAGGHCNKPHVLDTMDVQLASGVKSFARIHKNEVWLLKCCAGVSAQRGALKRSKIVEDLRQRLCETTSAVAEGEVAVAAEGVDPMDGLCDPMHALDDPAQPPASKRCKYSPKRTANRIVEMDMPVSPPTTSAAAVAAKGGGSGSGSGAADGNGGGPPATRRVSVLARSTNQLWLAVADIDWLVHYMAQEVACGGVPLEEPMPAVAGNCEVDDVRIRWDFGKKAWVAEFTGGLLVGQKFTSNVSNMSEEKWVMVQSQIGCNLAEASFEQRKEGTRLYLMGHCDRLSRNGDFDDRSGGLDN